MSQHMLWKTGKAVLPIQDSINLYARSSLGSVRKETKNVLHLFFSCKNVVNGPMRERQIDRCTRATAAVHK